MGTNLLFLRFATGQVHMNIQRCRATFWDLILGDLGFLFAERTAEGVGFEPTRACALPVFKTGAINHSTTPPDFALRDNCAIASSMSNCSGAL